MEDVSPPAATMPAAMAPYVDTGVLRQKPEAKAAKKTRPSVALNLRTNDKGHARLPVDLFDPGKKKPMKIFDENFGKQMAKYMGWFDENMKNSLGNRTLD